MQIPQLEENDGGQKREEEQRYRRAFTKFSVADRLLIGIIPMSSVLHRPFLLIDQQDIHRTFNLADRYPEVGFCLFDHFR